jgi:iron complex transport system substrate-binding protein
LKIFSEILGEQIEIPDNPERIVSLAPAITDTIYALEASDRLVGVSVFCDKPPAAKNKPKVGSYYKINYKILEELEPDLVLVTTGAQRGRITELRERGYTVIPIPLPTNLYDIMSNTLMIGVIINALDKARKLTRKMMATIHDLTAEYNRGSVYYEVDLGGPTSAGGITYIDHALRTLGLENIFGGERITWIINPDPNEIVKRNPDYIIYEPKPYSKYTIEGILEALKKRGLGVTKALAENRLIVLEPNSLAHYGPAIIDTLKEIKNKVDNL